MKYEGSKADDKADRKGANKTGMSMKAREKSGADKKADKAGQKSMGKKRKK